MAIAIESTHKLLMGSWAWLLQRLIEPNFASLRISLVRSISLTSRAPHSGSLRLTQSSSLCGVQPIIGAIDSTAAHIDEWSLRYSRTRRTACSRTSLANFLGFLSMARFPSRVRGSTKSSAVRMAFHILVTSEDGGSAMAKLFSAVYGAYQFAKRSWGD